MQKKLITLETLWLFICNTNNETQYYHEDNKDENLFVPKKGQVSPVAGAALAGRMLPPNNLPPNMAAANLR